MEYEPAPIDTSRVELPEELLELTEMLASNVHDVWARQRLADGWRYGRERNDRRKEHPDLIPYGQLPDSEKSYDRNTAIETIKVILALGYQIEPPESGASFPPEAITTDGEEVAPLLQTLESRPPPDLQALLLLWQTRNPTVWHRHPELYQRLGERILKLGEPLVAYDVVTRGREDWPHDLRLRQLLGHALFRSGATERANRVFQDLLDEGHTDEETLGFLARTHKDLATRASDCVERQNQQRRAAEAYLDAYQQTGGYWTGINAATLSLLIGETERAKRLACEVRNRCLQELERLEQYGADTYWPLATLGEAALILGEWSEAQDRYVRASEVGHGRHGDIGTTRRNALLLVQHLGCDREQIDRWLKMPRVVIFVGPRIDAPGCSLPGFPPQLEPAVRAAIRDRLAELDAQVGYASASSGEEILFLEGILERDGDAHMVLPYGREEFDRDSRAVIPGADWAERCERLCQRATEVVIASEQRLEGGTVSYEYGNLLLLGLATIHAQRLDTELVAMAICDGSLGSSREEAGSRIEYLRQLGLRIEIIDLTEIRGGELPEVTTDRSDAALQPLPPGSRSGGGPAHSAASSPEPEFTPQLGAILFADAEGFSTLQEEEIPRFVRHFLGAIADLAVQYRPVAENTWGDGLWFVFSQIEEAGRFALELCDLVSRTDWAEKGLPRHMGVRVALHAGPVYGCIDPVTRKPNYFGTHVSRAARIEPITPPNQVYASRAFAALASAQRVRDFICEYVGQTPLAKGYGTYPTYHVRRHGG
jgi:class 3 adenylate cyclase